MPGTVVIKPLEANFDNDLNKELAAGTSPYCVVTMGDKKIKGPSCKKGGKHPFWKGTFRLPRNEEPYCFIEIKNHQITPHEVIGVSEININELLIHGKTTKWYEVYFRKKQAGKILIEASIENSDIPLLEYDEIQDKEISEILPNENFVVKDNSFGLNLSEDVREKNDSFEEVIEKLENLGSNEEDTKEALGESLPIIMPEMIEDQGMIVNKADNLNASNAV